jgi:hypothetical protein
VQVYINFATASDRIEGSSAAVLNELLATLRNGPGMKLELVGHTDTQGNDLAQPETVRVYLWASSQHFADPLAKAPNRGVCQQPFNIVRTSMLFRAMLDAMDAWASHGTLPPDSRIPRRADGTLVAMAEWLRQFPRIPGVAIPSGPSDLPRLEFGQEFASGILKEPPTVMPGAGYTVLVPAVDADGNDSGGVRAPMVEAPLSDGTDRLYNLATVLNVLRGDRSHNLVVCGHINLMPVAWLASNMPA